MADLQRYPIVVSQNKQLRVALSSRQQETVLLRNSLTAKDSVIAATERQVQLGDVLRQEAESRATLYHLKAKQRGWVNVALTVLLVGLTYSAVAR